MQQIADWLKKLGMSEYAERFAENRIDLSVLPDLTDQHLEKLGVALGDRLKILRAIRELSANTVTAQPGPSAAPGVQDSAERRQLTVMFCDLVGSTALSGRLDPEDLRVIVGTYHRCCTALVERHGGFVAKYMGDGVLAYFGYPQAHEHDAERAVRAGIALVEAVSKLTTIGAGPLQVRIGIATGLVVVGDLIGAGAAQEQAVVGETPNLAARLQALAEPDAVVIASSTRRLTGGLFEYRDLGAVALKGFSKDVPAWQVLGVGAAESRFEALRATTTPLIGRDEEIDLLMRRWERAKRGDGSVVLIAGEPGIGKSRIAQTVVERISAEPHTRLRYFCSPHHQDSAFYPSISQLERAAGFRRDDTDEQRLAKLEGVLAQGTNDLSEAVPLLADLLSVPIGDRYPPLNLTPKKRKEKTLHVQLAQVEGLAAQQPVLIVWEDVHWSDPTTRESLDLLIDRVPTLRVLAFITFRPEFAPPWIGRPHVTMLTLNRLPSRQRAEMIAYVTGGKTLPREIADQIVDRTDGVPLFIEELTKTVVESGVVIDAGDHYCVTGPVAAFAIPTTLHASLLARLDRLAPTREVAQIGAALGRSFSHELISAMAMMPQQQLDDALAQLVRAELIFRRGTPPDAEYTFKHALVQDAAYSTLLKTRRQQIHSKIATTLEENFLDMVTAQPALLAHHCTEAGLIEKGLRYCIKAGQQAIAREAMTEAVAQVRKGLDLLSGIPEGTANKMEQELDLQIMLGHALGVAKGLTASELGEALARARQLCEQLNRPLELGLTQHARLVFRIVRGELERSEQDAEELRSFGEQEKEVMWVCAGSLWSGVAKCLVGKFVESRCSLESGLPSWNPMYRAVISWPFFDPNMLGVLFHRITLVCLGYVDQGRSRREEGLAEARRLSPYHLAYALGLALYGDWVIRDWKDLKSTRTILRSSEELLAVSSEHGFPGLVETGNIMRGWCLGVIGRTADGVSLLQQGIKVRRARGAAVFLPFYLAMLAEVSGIAGHPEEGLTSLAEAAKITETTQERWAEAEIYRLRGRLFLSINQHGAAEASYRNALAVARRQSAKFWELRAALDLARLWRDQGKRTEARDLLAPIYGWFTEGFDTPVLKEAKALLDELA
jgi:class 3 adenylate cyclase/tetratricopeptide (TPR) repeat protein